MHWVRNGGLVVYYIFPQWVVCVLVSQTSFKASLIFLFHLLRIIDPLPRVLLNSKSVLNQATWSFLLIKHNPLLNSSSANEDIYGKDQPIHQPKKGSHPLLIKNNFESLNQQDC